MSRVKKVNILIGIPAQDIVPTKFMLNLIGVLSYTKNHLKNVGEVNLAVKPGVRTDKNRNTILKEAIKKGDIDYIIWFDTDMIYPLDIICQYMRIDFDIIGCLYFKRPPPHDPVVFVKNKTSKAKPYNAIDPSSFEFENVYPVDAIGYGGMMVKMSVYEKLGKKKWTHYGKNYHLPFEAKDRLTHDLVFCQTCQDAGFKILAHGSVRAGHIAQKVITEDDYRFYRGIEPKKDKKPVKKKKIIKI